MGDDDLAQPVVREEVHAQALALFGPLSLHMGRNVLLLALVGHAPVLPVCVGLLDVLHLTELQLEPRLELIGVDDAAARVAEDERVENHGDRPQHCPDLSRATLEAAALRRAWSRNTSLSANARSASESDSMGVAGISMPSTMVARGDDVAAGTEASSQVAALRSGTGRHFPRRLRRICARDRWRRDGSPHGTATVPRNMSVGRRRQSDAGV